MKQKNVNSLFKLANLLDKKGKYGLSDKLDNLVKLSQFSPTPTELPTTQIDLPESLRPFLDPSTFKDSTFVNKNIMRQIDAPYASKFGPDTPLIFQTLSPVQYAELERTGKLQQILDIQSAQGAAALRYLASTGADIQGLGALIGQWSKAPNQNNKVIVENAIATTASQAVVDAISAVTINRNKFNFNEWQMKLNEITPQINRYPPALSRSIMQGIHTGLRRVINKLSTQNPDVLKRSISPSNPDWMSFASTHGLSSFTSQFGSGPVPPPVSKPATKPGAPTTPDTEAAPGNKPISGEPPD
jgi:hypothetical protein